MAERISIAIDGPSGAGKSTMAKSAASRFGLIYADTGAIYRTVGFAARRAGVGSKDAEGISKLLSETKIELRYEGNVQKMVLNGEDVTPFLREPEISIYASDVSAIPEVRAFLLEMQRSLAREHNVIMDGRDIGTVVLPDASLKIFLTADPEDRARRRYGELLERGSEVTFEEVLRDIEYRDRNDSSRAAAPLAVADDAVVIDTTGNTLSESVEMVCGLIAEKLGL